MATYQISIECSRCRACLKHRDSWVFYTPTQNLCFDCYLLYRKRKLLMRKIFEALGIVVFGFFIFLIIVLF